MPSRRRQRPGSSAPLAGFQTSIIGRFYPSTEALAGKYMTFQVAKEVYGIEILAVREIVGLPAITRVPRAPPFIRGVIDLRGRVIPVIDVPVKFGMPPLQPTDQAVIIVVQCLVAARPLTTGLLVDRVLEVVTIEDSQVEPPSAFGADAPDEQFMRGIGKTPHGIILLLDTARILSGERVTGMEGAALRA